MNKNRFYVGLLVAAILAVLVYASYGMVNAGKKETYHSVAVIVDDSSSDRWTAFKEGLEQGADEENFHINVVSTSSFVNLHEECSIISRELENGADGVIVQLCGDDADGLFSGIVSGVPTVLAENEGESESLFTTVMADPYEIGRTIGENLLAGAGDSLSGFTVGILSGNQKMKSQRLRLEGFQKAVERSGAEILWTLSDEEVGDQSALERYWKEKPASVLVALDNDETELAGDFILGLSGEKPKLYGEGCSEKIVYYLDKGVIASLVVPNEFFMGYQCVKELAEKINYHQDNGGTEDSVDFLSVTRENLYDRDTENILFKRNLKEHKTLSEKNEKTNVSGASGECDGMLLRRLRRGEKGYGADREDRADPLRSV